ESRHREDEGRRFVVSFRLSDDTLEVYEPPQRNAGILGGKFMERTRVPLPGGPGPSDPAGPAYYSAHVLHVGARLRLAGRAFRLLDADEYVFDYFERRVDELRVQLTPTPAASERLNLGADDVAGFAARRRTSAAIGGRQLTAAMAGPSSSSASTAAAASAAAELATPALERSNRDSVVRKLRVAAAGPSAAGAAAEVLGRLRAADSSGSGVLERGAVVREAAGLWSGLLDEHEAITLCRVFEPRPRKVDYERLVATILTR
ncbi:EF-hand domain-containing protein 1, partial [Cladochytrium tenue]